MTMVATRHDDGRQKLFFLTPTCLDSKNNGSYLIKLSSQVREIEQLPEPFNHYSIVEAWLSRRDRSNGARGLLLFIEAHGTRGMISL